MESMRSSPNTVPADQSSTQQEIDRLIEKDLDDLKKALLSKEDVEDVLNEARNWAQAQLREKYKYKNSSEEQLALLSKKKQDKKFQLVLSIRWRIGYLEDFLGVPTKDPLTGEFITGRAERWLAYFDIKKNDSFAKELKKRIEDAGSEVETFCKSLQVLYGDFSDRAAHKIPLPKDIVESDIDNLLRLFGLPMFANKPVKITVQVLITPLNCEKKE